MNPKVWIFRNGNEYVATPTTRGRRPRSGQLSDRRTYGVGKNKEAALSALAKTLGVKVEDFASVTDIKVVKAASLTKPAAA